MNKFDKLYNEIKNKIFYENINFRIKSRWSSIQNYQMRYEKDFLQTYKYLINQDYNIFPVPPLLLKDMVEFAIKQNGYAQKYYSIQDIRDKYSTNWNLYKYFLQNLDLMLKNNETCSITLITWKQEDDIQKFKIKYPNSDLIESEILKSKAFIYDYSKNYDLCLVVRIPKYIPESHQLNKNIQHQLIHWMQDSLNRGVKKQRGIFDDKPFILTNQQQKIINLLMSADFINYIASGVEFDPWVANTVEEFYQTSMTIEEFENQLKDFNKMVEHIELSVKRPGIREMWQFAWLCYLSSENDPTDKRYWYLIEAIKQNKII